MKLDPCNSNVKGESRTNSSTRCHACGRVNKQYKRRIHKDMINGLVRLYNLTVPNHLDEYFHIRKITVRSTDGAFAKLRWWGLIEEEFNVSTKKRTSGMWRLTPKGRAWITGKCAVPEKIKIRLDTFEGYEGAAMYVHDIFPSFDYSRLMGE